MKKVLLPLLLALITLHAVAQNPMCTNQDVQQEKSDAEEQIVGGFICDSYTANYAENQTHLAKWQIQQTVQRVVVNGSKNDRVNVYSGPDTAARVMKILPGGLILTLIAEIDGWYLVKLQRDQQGYIQKTEAKLE